MESAAKQIPAPPGRRLVGNTYDYERDRIGFLKRCQQKHGDVFRYSPKGIVVLDPDLTHQVFVRTNGPFTAEGPVFQGDPDAEWLRGQAESFTRFRKMAVLGLSQSQATNYSGPIADALHRAIHQTGGRLVDAHQLFEDFAVRSVVDYCFGADAPVFVELTKASVRTAKVILSSRLSLPQALPLPRTRRIADAERHLESATFELIRKRRESPRGRELQGGREAQRGEGDLLDTMLAAGSAPSEDEYIVQVLNAILRASTGVTSATLSWLSWLEGVQPDVLLPAREEASASTDPGVAGPQVEALVNELLRFYPPTWLLRRYVRTDTELDGYPLRQSEWVYVSPYLLHHDPRWWVEPERFDPARWLSAAKPHQRFAYVPFAAGPRSCVGANLGMQQLIVATNLLLAGYQVRPHRPRRVKPDPGQLLLPGALKVRIGRSIAQPAAG